DYHCYSTHSSDNHGLF
nr:immunoglobulin light chain junction region [Macaca mulatta]MOX33212.1 immunoglobulin light chain junction region [Macaca mulatta]MOX33225.1 immunoglobulin light chain junction region [Macaca mulatta]MOX33257.1 immunoglobulin light chain junction region [Macaca mulatta]MOX33435.1 immunoglobulin light chain junction region [Macaca mulatta]